MHLLQSCSGEFAAPAEVDKEAVVSCHPLEGKKTQPPGFFEAVAETQCADAGVALVPRSLEHLAVAVEIH